MTRKKSSNFGFCLDNFQLNVYFIPLNKKTKIWFNKLNGYKIKTKRFRIFAINMLMICFKVLLVTKKIFVHSAGAVEYTDCTSAEG